jgi:phosphodiesterase/alkaline phosphatase D-like protein
VDSTTPAVVQIQRTPPSAAVTSTSAITATTATVNGTVNPNTIALDSCFIDYGKTAALGSKVACTPAADSISGGDDVPVSAQLTGLTPGQAYFAAVEATGDQGLAVSTETSFTTLAIAPTIGAVKASSIKQTVAKVAVSVTSHGAATAVIFQYSKPATFPKRPKHSKTLHAAATASAKRLAVVLHGLKPHTKYHVRAVAINAKGAVVSKVITFKTKAKPKKKHKH